MIALSTNWLRKECGFWHWDGPARFLAPQKGWTERFNVLKENIRCPAYPIGLRKQAQENEVA